MPNIDQNEDNLHACAFLGSTTEHVEDGAFLVMSVFKPDYSEALIIVQIKFRKVFLTSNLLNEKFPCFQLKLHWLNRLLRPSVVFP